MSRQKQLEKEIEKLEKELKDLSKSSPEITNYIVVIADLLERKAELKGNKEERERIFKMLPYALTYGLKFDLTEKEMNEFIRMLEKLLENEKKRKI